jgi:hypothetical protein
MLIGYARVSTVDQNLALQQDAFSDRAALRRSRLNDALPCGAGARGFVAGDHRPIMEMRDLELGLKALLGRLPRHS